MTYYNVLLFGDSMVRGLEPPNFPYHFETSLHPGARLDAYSRRQLVTEVERYRDREDAFVLVFILIGTNNLSIGQSAESVVKEYDLLLREILGHSNVYVGVISIMPRLSPGLNGKIQQTNTVLQHAVKTFIGLGGAMAQDQYVRAYRPLIPKIAPGTFEIDKHYFNHDGLHLNQEGKALVSKYLMRIALNVINNHRKGQFQDQPPV